MQKQNTQRKASAPADKSAHTPGEWNYSDTAGSHQFAVYGEAGQDIALVYNRDERSEANARLIAAAPELLAALKCIQAEMNALKRDEPNANRRLQRLGGRFDWKLVVDDPIQKAEGR